MIKSILRILSAQSSRVISRSCSILTFSPILSAQTHEEAYLIHEIPHSSMLSPMQEIDNSHLEKMRFLRKFDYQNPRFSKANLLPRLINRDSTSRIIPQNFAYQSEDPPVPFPSGEEIKREVSEGKWKHWGGDVRVGSKTQSVRLFEEYYKRLRVDGVVGEQRDKEGNSGCNKLVKANKSPRRL